MAEAGPRRIGSRRPASASGRPALFFLQNRLTILLLAAGLLVLALLSLSWRVDVPEGDSRSRSLHTSGTTHPHSQAAAGPNSPLRLLLASHGRLIWYYPATNTSTVLHEGQGVHYGGFPGKLGPGGQLLSVWTVVRPHNWHPSSSEEVLMELDAETGLQLSRVKVPSRFTHDTVRRGDSVYMCNTEQGSVLELSFPSMELVRTMRLFTKRQHINTLAPLYPGTIWAVLHNLGRSEMVQIQIPPGSDPSAPASVVQRLTGVGTKSHGLVEWQGGFLSLDSDNAALVWVEAPQGERAAGAGEHTAVAKVKVLWKAPDQGRFFKGLAVVDGVAYFGISLSAPRSARQDPAVDSELGAWDLKGGRLLWRRQVPTRGLLNIISAPQLGEDSSYRPASTSAPSRPTTTPAATSRQLHLAAASPSASPAAAAAARQHILSNTAVQEASRKLAALGFAPRIGGRWATGLPFLDLAAKGTQTPWEAGLQLPLTMIDISKLQAVVAGTPDAMWRSEEQRRSNIVIEGRKGNTDQFKPGVQAIVLQFSDQSIDNTYRFPYYNYYKAALEPLLAQIIGADNIRNIVRLQFAKMPVGSSIHIHRDMGGYALKAHRIHIPVFTNADVSFQVCPKLDLRTKGHAHDEDIKAPDDCVQIPMAEGMVFELNNRVIHRVLNSSPDKARVQLVVDVAEAPRDAVELRPGTACRYVRATIVCEGIGGNGTAAAAAAGGGGRRLERGVSRSG